GNYSCRKIELFFNFGDGFQYFIKLLSICHQKSSACHEGERDLFGAGKIRVSFLALNLISEFKPKKPGEP
ncbi:MAG: hypothetical protein OIF36_05635, partial [Alphaproteobacteria bacterium]|nr:hypothetical protein [Alphaproteobacteria bacterium]